MVREVNLKIFAVLWNSSGNPKRAQTFFGLTRWKREQVMRKCAAAGITLHRRIGRPEKRKRSVLVGRLTAKDPIPLLTEQQTGGMKLRALYYHRKKFRELQQRLNPR